MLHKNRLFTPGPTPLLPAAQTAMASFTAHHRTADFKALYQRVLADMKEFVGTKNDVLVLACSGTGVMEASVSNLTSPGDKVLVLTAGKFGERWTGLAKAFGCQVDVLSVPYGETVTYGQLAQRLADRNGRRCVGSRAVGQFMGSNPLPVIVPCHRVIGADGSLTGYGGGLERKRLLLDLEAGVLPLALQPAISNEA